MVRRFEILVESLFENVENDLTHWIGFIILTLCRRKMAENSTVKSYGVVDLKVHCFFVKILTPMDVSSVFSCALLDCI